MSARALSRSSSSAVVHAAPWALQDSVASLVQAAVASGSDDDGRLRPRGASPAGRIASVSARALAVSIGVAPIAIALVLMGQDTAGGAALFEVLALLSAALVFALERRDASEPAVLARAALGGALATLAAPVVITCLAHAGDPPGMITALGRIARDAALEVLGAAANVALLAPAWGHLLLVRRCTRRRLPQLGAGLSVAGLATVLVALDGPVRSGPWTIAILSSGALVPTSLAIADRCCARLDPRGAGPAVERPIGPVFAAWPLATAVTLSLALLLWIAAWVISPGHHPNHEGAAISRLKAIETAQRMTALQDRDADGRPDVARALVELLRSGALDGASIHRGYDFHVAGDPLLERWCATADPVAPGTTGDRRFWMNQAGRIFYTSALRSPPAPLDPAAGPPQGWIVLGK